jgi:hypothetical protein
MRHTGANATRLACNHGIDRDPGADRDVRAAPGLDHPSRDLVPDQERERPEAGECRRPQLPVPEQVQVAATDATDGHRDARPGVVRQLRLVDLHQLGAERRILQIELDRAHAPEVMRAA